MLRWAIVFFIVALVAAVFGFLGIATAAVGIARILFFKSDPVTPETHRSGDSK